MTSFQNASMNEAVHQLSEYMETSLTQTVVLSAMATLFIVSLCGQMFFFNQKSLSDWNTRGQVATNKSETLRELEGVTVKSPVEANSVEKIREEGKNKVFTWEEVSKHNKPDDLWLVVEGKAFDVTKFMARHPGGHRPLLAMAGRDSTEVMNEFHPAPVFDKMLPKFYVGDVADYKVPEIIKDYRAIRQGLLARGLFETDPAYYYAKYVWLASIFMPGVYLVSFNSFAAHMLSAALMALFWQQLAFVGHDLGHNSVSHVRSKDYYWGGLIGNFLGGIGLTWWKSSHNTHHVTCNSVEHDPDIQHLPLFAVSNKLFGRFFSTYHDKFFETDAVARFLVSYQHFLFLPVMGVARFNLYIQSWILLLFRNEPAPYKMIECLSLAGFWLWFGTLISYLPSDERVSYLLLSHALSGVLNLQITISHFSMDVFNGICQDDWILHQCKTSMDVTCAKYMDWFHGGLQFQIEHHLFPRLPRHNLRIARHQLLQLAAKHELPYVEMSFLEANIRTLKCMKEAALEARALKKGDAGFYESPLYEMLNAQG